MLHICYGGFCHFKFVCSGCSIPTERLACAKCRHRCKREPGCGYLATNITRVTCIKCWEVNVYYEDCWEKVEAMWFWREVDKRAGGRNEERESAREKRDTEKEGGGEREKE